MATVTFDRTSCIYPGSSSPAVDELELTIAEGEFLVLVGPSGCGKTTSLRMLAGLEPVHSGSILMDGQDVTELAPRDRDIAMVFQNYALYPHMTVEENVGFALRMSGVAKVPRAARVGDAAGLLGLGGLLRRKPGQLSGGQRQRVAMGRAIVREPRVFLMDEPLSNLDAQLRVQTRIEIAALQRRLGVTTVYVTHDQVEAMTMADRVAVMKGGVLQQCDSPRLLYQRPINAFVAGFIGSPPMNLVECDVEQGVARLGQARLPLPRDVVTLLGNRSRVTMGFRPESLLPDAGGDVELFVDVVEELGSDAYAHGRLSAVEQSTGPAHKVVARVDAAAPPTRRDVLRLSLRPGARFAFDVSDGVLLGVF